MEGLLKKQGNTAYLLLTNTGGKKIIRSEAFATPPTQGYGTLSTDNNGKYLFNATP